MAIDIPVNPELAASIKSTAKNLGIDPVDLASAISFETAGTFDPWKRGPTTQWGEHRGLIQWGEPQRQKYGVVEGQPVGEQMDAVGRYLKDAGVKPGSGLLDIYSAINAGRVGRYNASDAANGGAPGTVADKVAGMAPHRVRAQLLLDGKLPASLSAPSQAPQAPQASAPVGMGGGGSLAMPALAAPDDAGEGDSLAPLIEAARRIAAATHEREELPSALPPLQLGRFPMLGGMNARGNRNGIA